jgi:hypothetical protein
MKTMTSERKAMSNRMNGRKSGGPRTAAGRARSRRNALRHGLAAFGGGKDPALFETVEQMAKAICGGNANPLLFEQALLIAENELWLRCIQAESIARVERLQDETAIALAKGDNSLAVAQALFDEVKRAHCGFKILRTVSGDKQPTIPAQVSDEIPMPAWEPPCPKERDEYEAMCEAAPDLDRLRRYQRRAWSRRKRAIRAFIAIKATQSKATTSPIENQNETNFGR